jgi:Fe-S oxidoreductase
VRALLDWALGLDRRRALPAFKRETLRDWAAARPAPAREASRTRVLLYPDLYTNHVHTARGRAAVRALEALGAAVEVPSVPGSGRAPLSQGMIASAERKAEAVWDALREPIEAGRDVVVVEPTDLAMFRRRYRKLLPPAAATALRDATYDVMEYVGKLLDEGADAGALRAGDGQGVAYHSHCQQRTLNLEGPTVEVLEALGYDVETSSAECCGMAGSFGYKSEYYELSMEVGQQLRAQLGDAAADGRVVAASGTSCQEQLEALLEGPVRHPIQLVAPAA